MQATMEFSRVESEQFNREHRRYYDTVTWLAEVLPGSMRTPFEYTFDGHELYAADGSKVSKIFDDALKEAESNLTHLPFEARRRKIEQEEYQDMVAMMGGDLPNTMVVVSDFPPELQHAKTDIGGYNVTRKQTMLRVLTKTPEGTLKMYSQSLDGSDRRSLEALYDHLGYVARPGELLGQRMHLEMDPYSQEFLIDQLTGVYDRMMRTQYGGEWYAGRPGAARRNTYDFVREQDDLLQTYLAMTRDFSGGAADYNLAAAMEARYHKADSAMVDKAAVNQFGPARFALTIAEMEYAGKYARALGKGYSGCGATIDAASDTTPEAQLEAAGYGNKTETSAEEDDFGPLRFKCPKGHWNKRPRAKSPKDFLSHCKTCKTSLKC